MNAVAELERGRRASGRAEWRTAHEALSAADGAQPLGAEDRELLAMSAYMIGHEAEYLDHLERLHRDHLEAGRPLAAVRCAFWLGAMLARRGELGRAGGWLGRAARLLDRQAGEHVERGYLLLPAAFEQEARGAWEAAASIAGEAVAIAERFGDADLFALAAHEQGHVLILLGRVDEGLRLLDEAMVPATTEELSPIVAGIVYCGVILACQDAFEVRRSQEWTAALSRWCEQQPDLVAFTGRCLVHRAEIMQLQGAWTEALDEARRAAERCLRGENPAAAGEGWYRQGEIHRLRGELDRAEAAYREASRYGHEPQPGLALLRVGQGDLEAARAAIDRATVEASLPAERARLLPARVEILLAVGDLQAARDACRELESIVAGRDGGSGALDAVTAHARGTVALAEHDAREALRALRRAAGIWQELGAPYEIARTRVPVGLACRDLGDEDAAALELQAAQAAFTALGATPDAARVGALVARTHPDAHGLTDRELEVLRRVAAGATNKAIAAELVLSTRTVDRHVSNIFAKLGVSSRAAATSFAHRHRLV